MVAGSKGPPRGLQFKGCGRGHRLAALLALLALGACGFGSAPPKAAAHKPSPSASPSPSPSAAAASAYWVLATLGLRLHQSPDTGSTVVTVLRPGAQLDVSETRTVGLTVWLHVHAHAQADLDGWVVNDPLLVTSIPMQQHDDAGLGYSLLFPTAWTYSSGGPASSFFTSADGHQKLVVEIADSLAHLPPGAHLCRQAGPRGGAAGRLRQEPGSHLLQARRGRLGALRELPLGQRPGVRLRLPRGAARLQPPEANPGQRHHPVTPARTRPGVRPPPPSSPDGPLPAAVPGPRSRPRGRRRTRCRS